MLKLEVVELHLSSALISPLVTSVMSAISTLQMLASIL